MVSESYTVRIEAPPDRVWAVMTDLENWPQWAPSVKRVQRLDNGGFGEGSQAKLTVKGAPTSVWTVSTSRRAKRSPGRRRRAASNR